MNLSRRWELVAAVGAALVMVVMLGREAQAERLWTERPAELRASPGDDSQIVKRVGKGRSLEVVKRLGTWVQVEYEGRTGWIRRTALSTEPVSGGSSDADDKEDKKKSDDGADEDEGSTKAASAGAKKSAAKKKADRKKSRKSRRGSGKDLSDEELEDEEEVSSRKKDDDDDKPRRPRSTWAARGRLPGGPLKVEIQALSAQAFSEPDGSGSVVFTVAEGDQVKVIARGENRWLLVENTKKRTGWIPAVAVRDHGLLLDARKDASKARGDDEDDEEVAASDADEDEVSEGKSKKSKKTAELDDESEDLDESSEDDSEDSRSSSDDSDVELGSSSFDDDIGTTKKPWTANVGLRAGFGLTGVDRAPGGVAAEETSYSGPLAGLNGEFVYKLKPKIGVHADLTYDFTYPLGGLTHTAGGMEQADISAQLHRVAATVGGSYGKDAMFIVRAGYSYSVLKLSDVANPANLPSESTSGPLAGLAFAYRFAASGLGTRIGVDALLFGSRSQTEGQGDGADLDSMLGLFGTAMVDYPLGKSLTVLGGYRFGRTTATWAGASERSGAMATETTDQSHEISLGVGLRL